MLDLKYRPRCFADVLGNDGVKRLLLKRSTQHSLSQQSMMFGGPKGCGKTTLARIVARAMKCTNLQNGEPCNECDSCISILDGTNQDVEELDAASQGTIDKIREIIRDSEFSSGDGTDLRIYFFDEAQRLSKPAQDALLQAIESRTFIVILCTTEPHKIVGPIRDRVEEYNIQPPSKDDLIIRLKDICNKEGFQYEDTALDVIAEMCSRTPRSSLLALESMSILGSITKLTVSQYYRFESYELIGRVLSTLDTDIKKAFDFLDRLSWKESPTWIRDTIIEAISGAFRLSIGAKSKFPVSTEFFSSRGRGWLSIAQDLGSVDRPSISDIEAILLRDIQSIPLFTPIAQSLPSAGETTVILPSVTTSTPSPVTTPPASSMVVTPATPPPATPPPATPPPATPPPATPPTPKASKAGPPPIEVNGVKYTKDEDLTSLDKSVVFTVPTKEVVKQTEVCVKLDRERIPISEAEFAASFTRRLGG
jgi:DNA polymerase-3 subunit gamma/tau